ncbi:MAG: ATP-binding protein [Alphaproteobacteria bacterium]
MAFPTPVAPGVEAVGVPGPTAPPDGAPENAPADAPVATARGRIFRQLVSGRLGRRLALILAIAAAASGVATFAVLSGTAPLGLDPSITVLLLNLDLVLLLALGAVVARAIVKLWTERRRRLAGSRLHVRFVVMFSIVAVTPAIIVALFSALFLNLGLQAWFDQKVGTALSQSLVVAKAYLREHRQIIRGDVLAMANDINREGSVLLRQPERLNRIVTAQATLRSLPEAIVFTGSGRVLARSGLTFSLELERVSDAAMQRARRGEVVVIVNEDEDRVRALVQLQRFVDTYLFVGRFVDAEVLGYMERASSAVTDYRRLEGQRSGIQITFSLIFVVVALMLLLAAVWLGLTFANQLARPLSRLVAAAERVRAGDLLTRVPESADEDEIGSLSRSFNRMTSQLEHQRRELIEANRQSETRRRFSEAVLAGVSAGVVGLDQDGRVHLPNRSASEFLGIDLTGAIGRSLGEVVPEMADALAAARRQPARLLESQISLARKGVMRTLLVRVAAEHDGGKVRGFVVTFDDITELLSAQRKAAWGDVARRIAHEIKNPLTPIQLSAERLKRKYLDRVGDDSETFEICTDTIVRQVGTIGRMVDEFSAFARMPAPVFKSADLSKIGRQALFLEKNAHPDIVFDGDFPRRPADMECDGRQVAQAVTNLLKNAVEAIEGRPAPKGADPALPPGHVRLSVIVDADAAVIAVEDNGKGLPEDERARLTEPYVTTRDKGTGLGLAIVKKIMEDHGGDLRLEDLEDGPGARASLVFPMAAAAARHGAGEKGAAAGTA